MEKCFKCNSGMIQLKDKTPDNVEYEYYRCRKCGNEILNMNQLHKVAEKYRKMKQYHAKVSKWGQSLGLRIPKELVKKYGFKRNKEVRLIPDKRCIKIMPV